MSSSPRNGFAVIAGGARPYARLEGWPRVHALCPSFETLASQAPPATTAKPLRRDEVGTGSFAGDDGCQRGTIAFNELRRIQFSNSSRQFTPSLPGSTRQSIFFENGLAKIDGCPGHLARRRASRFCPGMTSVDISTPDTHSCALAAPCARGVDEASAQWRAWGTPGARCTRGLVCTLYW